MPWATSAANEGPDRAAIRPSNPGGSASVSTSCMSRRLPISMPLDAVTTQASASIAPAARLMTCRTTWEGVTLTTTQAPATASSRSWVGRTGSGIRRPGR